MELCKIKRITFLSLRCKRKKSTQTYFSYFILSTEKFAAPSFSLLYANHIEALSDSFIVYLQLKCLKNFMQPNKRYLIFASCLLNKQK